MLLRIDQANPTISIIVPVYNVEPYLRRCFDSILSQTFTGYEVIIIDDASTDGSLEIIKEYDALYDNFHSIILEKNQGNGPARNLGLSMAKGEYIAFMDSDDYVEPEFLSHMLTAAREQDADIVMCQYQIIRPSGYILYKHPGRNETLTAKKALCRLYRDISIHHFVWNKLYRHSLFVESNFSFPQMIFEDIASVHELFHHANKVVLLKDILYNYSQRKNSIFATINPKRLDDNVRALAITKSYLKSHNCFDDYRSAYHFALTRNMITITGDILLMHIREKKSGLWRDFKYYWSWMLSLYDHTPVALRNKEKENLPT